MQNAAIAQLVEHFIRNEKVVGSSPTRGSLDPLELIGFQGIGCFFKQGRSTQIALFSSVLDNLLYPYSTYMSVRLKQDRIFRG